MTTNRDWLFLLPLEEQYAWMNAEHQEPNPDCSAMIYKTFAGNMEHEVEQDSRERLEADIRDTVTERHVDTIIGWLDRQAAITERETKLRELYKFEENHREHIRSLEEVNRKLNERIAELQSQSDEKWNLYVAERGRADRLATDLGRCGVERETFRETTTVLMDSITDGLREVNAILDGKDEGLA